MKSEADKNQEITEIMSDLITLRDKSSQFDELQFLSQLIDVACVEASDQIKTRKLAQAMLGILIHQHVKDGGCASN